MKNKNISWILLVITAVLFSLGWATTYGVFNFENSYPIWLVAIVFVLAMLFLCLFLIVCKSMKTIHLSVAVVLLPAILLATGQLAAMAGLWLLAVIMFGAGARLVKSEQSSRIKINVYMILRRGFPIIGMALSILIASAFYFSLVEKQKLSAIPRINLELSEKMTTRLIKVVALVVPAQELDLIQQGITVDEYIEQNLTQNELIFEQGQPFGDEGTVPRSELESFDFSQADEQMRNAMLSKGRTALGEQLGMELTGQEQMSQVINELLEKRMNDFLNGDTSNRELLPIGAGLAMYVLLQTLAWLAGYLLFWTAAGIFTILVRLDLVEIASSMEEVEEIA